MTMTLPILGRLAAFTREPKGGNPAGVWLGHVLPEPREMQRIAADVGYSETAFLARTADATYRVRYYSPEAEVSFCGHATVAAGVFLGELHGEGSYRFDTTIGQVSVRVDESNDGFRASLTSVNPKQAAPPLALLEGALAALGWSAADLDGAIPPRLAWAGAWHLVLAVAKPSRLQELSYDFAALKALMLEAGLTTLQLIWREDEGTFHARNPFPVGGVVEDPATGAAAAALGGYLRDAGLVAAPRSMVIHQGHAMGRPSRIEVQVPVSGGITVTGTAAWLESPLRPVAADEAAAHLARAFLARVWSVPADLGAIDELMTEDYVLTSAGTAVRGRSAFAAWVRAFHEKLPGATNEVLEVFSDRAGTRVVARWICRGQSGGIFGLPADGQPVSFSGIALWHVRDGRLAEGWVERSALEAVRAHGGADLVVDGSR